MTFRRSWRASAAYKAVLIAIGWVSVVATTGVFDGQFSLAPLGMFTTQSNLLCVAYFTVAAVRLWLGHDRDSRPFAPAWKGIATMAVAVTLLVAWLILRMSVTFESAASASLLGLHVLVPLMAIGDGLLFDRPGLLRWRDPWLWLIAPVVYLGEFVVVTAAGGQLGGGTAAGPGGGTSRAPYPFLDVETLGVGGVALNAAMIAAAVLAVGCVVVLVDRKRGRALAIT